jgi:N-acetylglucosamine kinase-like BadF-type ATPase
MRDDAIFVGVDGGATGSRALALDAAGRERGRADGPPAPVWDGDTGEAVAVVASLVRDVAAAAGSGPVARVVVGLAGAGRSPARDAVRAALVERGVAPAVDVVSDGDVAYHDAFGAGAGILLLSGTGSMALGRSAAGREARAGGWGALLGDEGSGWALGVHGLRAVARAADGRGPATALTAALLPALALRSAPDLIAWVRGRSKRDVAALAPLVLQAAAAGDPVAIALRDDAARELAGAADAVRRALEPWDAPPSVALVGGLIAAGGLLRARVEAELAALSVRVDPRDVVPARGAARRALEGSWDALSDR